MALTDIKIKNLKSKDKAYKSFDSGGLYLLVHKNGGKYWKLKYRYMGKEKLLSIGVYPTVSLKKAREARDNAKALLAEGTDPGLQKKTQKATQTAKHEATFERVALLWIERNGYSEHGKGWSQQHTEDVQRSLETNIFPSIGQMPIEEITTPILGDLLKKVEKRGSLETAKRLRQRCSSIFRFGIASGLCHNDPAEYLKDVLRPPKKQNMAALPPEEFPEYLQKLERCNMTPQTRLAIKLMTLTFVRNSEMREASWEEIDWEKRLWVIPAERMKKKDQGDHVVPLAHQAIEVLEQLKELNGHREWVFPQIKNPRMPMSDGAIAAVIKRIGYRGKMTVHGYRSVASSVLNESGKFSPDAIERQLHHKEKNEVRGAYNRAEYLEERKAMMQWWADWIDTAI